MRIAGRNISVKPIKSVSDIAAASGIPIHCSNGTKGRPNQVNIGVYSAKIVPNVPIAITTGKTPNQVSKTVLTPSFAKENRLGDFSAFNIA